MKRVALVRAAWGALLLVETRRVLKAARAPEQGEKSVRIARLLGSRQLAQGMVTLLAGGARARRLGAVVDGLHAASAGALALLSPRWRSVAAADAVLATGFAVTGARTRMDSTPAGRHTSVTTITGGAS